MPRVILLSRLTLALTFCAAPLPSATAQRADAAVVSVRSPVGPQAAAIGDMTHLSGGSAVRLGLARDSVRGATAWAVLASAVVPGTGQALLGQDRFIAYLAVEAFAWARYRADSREGQRARATYRRLASEVARRPFSAVRPVGDFEYYERMEKFAESGVFDAVDGGQLEPELDTTTANGAIWLLARQTYWADPNTAPAVESPEYARAAAFYRERAIRPEYRYSWGNARLEYAEFRRTIRRANNAYRTSLQDLGLVIANHALSTVDAFITVRLRRQGDTRSTERYEVFGEIPFRWDVAGRK
jgi:hypothetical protein